MKITEYEIVSVPKETELGVDEILVAITFFVKGDTQLYGNDLFFYLNNSNLIIHNGDGNAIIEFENAGKSRTIQECDDIAIAGIKIGMDSTDYPVNIEARFGRP